MRRLAGLLFILASAVFPIAALSWGLRQASIHCQSHRSLRANLAVVVNLSNPVQNLSFPELRRIFLGERSHCPMAAASPSYDGARPA